MSRHIAHKPKRKEGLLAHLCVDHGFFGDHRFKLPPETQLSAVNAQVDMRRSFLGHANLHLIEVDVSDFNDESQAMLDNLGSAGPPTMVFLDAAQSEAKGTRLIGNINSKQMLSSIRAVAR